MALETLCSDSSSTVSSLLDLDLSSKLRFRWLNLTRSSSTHGLEFGLYRGIWNWRVLNVTEELNFCKSKESEQEDQHFRGHVNLGKYSREIL